MAREWVSWVLDRSPTCGGSARLVLVILAERADKDGFCWPSVADIARRACLQERRTQIILRRLKIDGQIRILTGGKGPRHPNGYLLVGERDAAMIDGLADKSQAFLAWRLRAHARTPLATEKGRTREPMRAHFEIAKGAFGGPKRAHAPTPEPTAEPVSKPPKEPEEKTFLCERKAAAGNGNGTAARPVSFEIDLDAARRAANGNGLAVGKVISEHGAAGLQARLRTATDPKEKDRLFEETLRQRAADKDKQSKAALRKLLAESPDAEAYHERIGKILQAGGCDARFIAEVLETKAPPALVEGIAGEYADARQPIRKPGAWFRDRLRRAGVKI